MDKVGSEKSWTFRRYRAEDARMWDEMVDSSPNATFLFRRGYMDYHSDRFEDHSIIAYYDRRPLALLPANRVGDTLFSHQGLSYGGWILAPRHLPTSRICQLWESFIPWLRDDGFKKLDYKPLPSFYHLQPHEEDVYMLWRLGAEPVSVTLSSTIDLRSAAGFNLMQQRHLKRALTEGFKLQEQSDVRPFVVLLEECLQTRHGLVPVHSANELALLKSRFPENIRIFTVGDPASPLAGVCVYDTGLVAHAQYIAANEEGRRRNLLSLLFHHLISDIFAHRRYFDFGISTEDAGKRLNCGLADQKWSLGGTGTVYQRFILTL